MQLLLWVMRFSKLASRCSCMQLQCSECYAPLLWSAMLLQLTKPVADSVRLLHMFDQIITIVFL